MACSALNVDFNGVRFDPLGSRILHTSPLKLRNRSSSLSELSLTAFVLGRFCATESQCRMDKDVARACKL